MNCEEIDRKRMRLKVLERLRRAGGATLAIGDDGATQITVFRNTNVQEIAREVLDLSAAGLKARNILSWESLDEQQYIAPLQKIVETGQTRAEWLLELYDGRWHGDIDNIYRELAY